MATPFQLHGRTSTDSGLYPWVIGSITRSLFFYGEATASRANRGASAIAAYYSLFHLGLFLMFGCPRHLSEYERNRINEGLDDGAADPNPKISHRNLVAFLERVVSANGLQATVLDAVRWAKDVRETINYGPRMLSCADGGITLGNCAIQPGIVDAILAGSPQVYEDAIAWACRNGEDGGEWIATALGQADAFFVGPQRLYGGWCSDKTAQVAEQMRQTLVTTANHIAFA